MSEFLDRISKLSPQRLALLADELNARLQAFESRRTVPLAIVGIGCRLPGGVIDPETFWKLLRDGVDAVGEVPAGRWNVEEFYDRSPDTPGRMATRWGGFIDGPEQFDAKFFGIAPAEAVCMDPQQRLLLETSWEALEHAAIAPSSLAGTSTGVFVGLCNGDYSQVALNAPREAITPYFASGSSHAVAAGRISYVLGLQGPSLAVDTSCSASLVAVHLACQSLRLGECDTALAGGVNLILNPDITIALSQGRMMAPDGRCKAFSELANGFVRAEGAAMIVLKRLPDAIQDRNRILAVVRGTACNQDGRSSGLTAPNGPSQEAVISLALADARVQAKDVDYIEAHGTGTALGDPIEAGALNAVFGRMPARSQPLFVGSVKTNLGHLESAAGIAGLVKLVLSLEHGEIPASLHLGIPNSRIEWDRLPLKVPAALTAWNRTGPSRIGGVSSFGFSGTNAHVIVEEYSHPVSLTLAEDRPMLLTLSAKSEMALSAIASRLRHHLQQNPGLKLADIARTLNAGRSHFEYRCCLVASAESELISLLDIYLQDIAGRRSAPASVQSGRAASRSPRVAFLFPRRSLSRSGAGRELYRSVPKFREAVGRCEEILKDKFALPAQSAFSGDEPGMFPAGYQQAAEFALQYALAESWRSIGIEPAAAVGYGVGEYAAACIAGVLSLEDGLALAMAEGSIRIDAQACQISYQEPRIAFIPASAVTTENSNRQPIWPRSSAPISSVAFALLEQDSAANLWMGGDAAGEELRRAAESDMAGKAIASFDRPDAECAGLLSAAGSLYILGCNLDLSGFYGSVANAVSLPTYPFQRERYWLDLGGRVNAGTGSRAATAKKIELANGLHATGAYETEPIEDDAGSTEEREWIYQLDWIARPLVGNTPGQTHAFGNRIVGTSQVIEASAELTRVAQLASVCAPVYSTIIVEALREAGLSPLPEGAFTLEEVSARLKLLPARLRLLARFFGILVEDGVVELTPDGFRFVDFGPRPDADRELDRLSFLYPECSTELKILRRCGKKLSAVLQGAYDPMQLVFADGSIDETEHIYEQSPVCRFFNDQAATRIRAAVDGCARRPARLLEIGGGTGATTGPILAALADRDIAYCFTDISAAFLSRARSKFSHVSSMHYRVLDIERDPVTQGFAAGGYDVIIAANVLHATTDLRHTLAHVRTLLAPGGTLLLIEGVRPDRWLDLTLGLTDGWWRFADSDLRPEHPLISASTWASLLSEAGIGSPRTVSYAMDDGEPSQQIVIVAQADGVPRNDVPVSGRRDWLIFADELGIGDALDSLLRGVGERCEIIRRPHSSDANASVIRAFETRTDRATLEVVYLWGTDVAESADSVAELERGVEFNGKVLVHLIQALMVRGNSAGLTIATRGAQATGNFSPGLGGAAQALAWGLGRTFGLEAPAQYRALIDLDPAMTPQDAAASLLAELLAGDREDEIAYRDRERLVARLNRSRLEMQDIPTAGTGPGTHPGLREDASYLLVGGLGGVGLRLAGWCAEQRPGHLILLSRTGTSAGAFAAERLRAIEEIEAMGVKVTIVEGDVSSHSEMENLFDRFGTEFPPLRGIFHAATDLSTADLRDLTDEQMESMLRPKIWGTWVLHQLTRKLTLDFFLVFSSSASLLGAKSSAHYIAACQFQDAFAHARRAAGLPMLTINWGAWDVLRLVSREQQGRLRETGILPMSSEKIFSLMDRLTASCRAQVMIANIDWTVLKPIFEVHRPRPLLENLGQKRHPSTPKIFAPSPARADFGVTGSMSPEDRRKFIEAFVMEQAGRVLGFRHGELPPVDVPLPDLGLDSLMAVDLKNSLQSALGQQLPPTIVFDYPTVAGMVGLLETMLWAAHGGGTADSATAQRDEIRL